MKPESPNDRLLNHIIVYGFSLAFGLVAASLQALHPTTSGFAIVLSGWSLVALLIGALVTLPCFWTIVHSARARSRRTALTIICLFGLGAFFYPMRVVPPEKYRPVFMGLLAAIAALSVLGCLLLLLHQFFERDARRNEAKPNPAEDSL